MIESIEASIVGIVPAGLETNQKILTFKDVMLVIFSQVGLGITI